MRRFLYSIATLCAVAAAVFVLIMLGETIGSNL